MKITDYATRSAAMDFHLKGIDTVGIEIGVDAGSHAEALLKYCSVKFITLVDIWDSQWVAGYCEGRLVSQGYKNRFKMVHGRSHVVVNEFQPDTADFIYIDIPHDYHTVQQSLKDWWPMLKKGGVLGYRNYADSNKELKKAVDEFINEHKLKHTVERYHGEIVIFK